MLELHNSLKLFLEQYLKSMRLQMFYFAPKKSDGFFWGGGGAMKGK